MRVEPSGIELVPQSGEVIIHAAWRAGMFWPTQCWGQAQCGTCVLRVLEGAEHTSAMSAEERRTLERYGWLRRDVAARLACRTTVETGSVRVHKGGVRPASPLDDIPDFD